MAVDQQGALLDLDMPSITSHEVVPLNLQLSPFDQLMSFIEGLRADVNILKEEMSSKKRKRQRDDTDDEAVKKKSKRVTVQEVFEKVNRVEIDLKKQLNCIIETLRNAEFQIIEVIENNEQ